MSARPRSRKAPQAAPAGSRVAPLSGLPAGSAAPVRRSLTQAWRTRRPRPAAGVRGAHRPRLRSRRRPAVRPAPPAAAPAAQRAERASRSSTTRPGTSCATSSRARRTAHGGWAAVAGPAGEDRRPGPDRGRDPRHRRAVGDARHRPRGPAPGQGRSRCTRRARTPATASGRRCRSRRSSTPTSASSRWPNAAGPAPSRPGWRSRTAASPDRAVSPMDPLRPFVVRPAPAYVRRRGGNEVLGADRRAQPRARPHRGPAQGALRARLLDRHAPRPGHRPRRAGAARPLLHAAAQGPRLQQQRGAHLRALPHRRPGLQARLQDRRRRPAASAALRLRPHRPARRARGRGCAAPSTSCATAGRSPTS